MPSRTVAVGPTCGARVAAVLARAAAAPVGRGCRSDPALLYAPL